MHDEPTSSFKTYEYLKSAPDIAWAWEFLRRNPKIDHEWAGLKVAWKETQSDGLRVIHVGDDIAASDAPILWASPRDTDSRRATVVWNPKLCTRSLDIVSVPIRFGVKAAVFDFETLFVEKTLLIDARGAQALVFQQGARSLQLNVIGEPLMVPVALFIDLATSKAAPDCQLLLLKALLTLRTTGALQSINFPSHPRATRNAFVLQALDGYLAGQRHRDIAVGLYGEARVDRDWNAQGEHMRDAVRRAIGRGVRLMNFGFAEFLR
jgi:hypothetical protein